MGKVRQTITFIGRVQGVGFRYRTETVAMGFDVAGWVRNEADGSVLCVAEGEPDELDRFLNAIREAMAGNIREVRVERSEATGEFEGFGIRR